MICSGDSFYYKKEAQILKMIDHPNLVKCISVHHDKFDHPAIVMNLLEGPELFDAIIKQHESHDYGFSSNFKFINSPRL